MESAAAWRYARVSLPAPVAAVWAAWTVSPATLSRTTGPPLQKREERLRHAPAAVLEFLAAAAGTGFVPADFWLIPANGREVELELGTVPLSIAGDGVALRHPTAVPARHRTGGRGGGRRMFAKEKLRKGGKEIFEGLHI